MTMNNKNKQISKTLLDSWSKFCYYCLFAVALDKFLAATIRLNQLNILLILFESNSIRVSSGQQDRKRLFWSVLSATVLAGMYVSVFVCVTHRGGCKPSQKTKDSLRQVIERRMGDILLTDQWKLQRNCSYNWFNFILFSFLDIFTFKIPQAMIFNTLSHPNRPLLCPWRPWCWNTSMIAHWCFSSIVFINSCVLFSFCYFKWEIEFSVRSYLLWNVVSIGIFKKY